jgi:hypothetical protein
VVPDDSFDSASHGEQITITSGGGIELESEWKRFRAQRRRKADPGQAAELNGCVFRRDTPAAGLERRLILDPWSCARSGREEQRICPSERERRKPPAQLRSVRVQRGAVLLIGDVVRAGGHDGARPAGIQPRQPIRHLRQIVLTGDPSRLLKSRANGIE